MLQHCNTVFLGPYPLVMYASVMGPGVQPSTSCALCTYAHLRPWVLTFVLLACFVLFCGLHITRGGNSACISPPPGKQLEAAYYMKQLTE